MAALLTILKSLVRVKVDLVPFGRAWGVTYSLLVSDSETKDLLVFLLDELLFLGEISFEFVKIVLSRTENFFCSSI